MKHKIKVFLVTIFILVFLLLAGYLSLTFYYWKHFSVNTWINGVYCTGKTVNEVNTELLSRIEAPIIMVTDLADRKYELNLTDMNYQADYRDGIRKLQKMQPAHLWPDNLTAPKNYEVSPDITYDKEALKEAFYTLPSIKEAMQREEDYRLEYTAENGYQLYDGLSGRLDTEKLFQLFTKAIDAGKTGFLLETVSCLYDVPLTAEQKEIQALWEKLEEYFQCDIVYDMGAEQIPLTTKQLSDFLKAENGLPVLDEAGNFVLNEEAVEQFVEDLAAEYDTYGKEREFQSTRGDMVTVKGGTYGTQLNQKEEVTFLSDSLLAEEMHTGVERKHIPVYEREGVVRGRDDIGDTYIEIDMTQQKLYYYADGELKVETDVVTGNERRRMSTPEGINYVYNKQRNRILRGEGYASPVDYWMPVKGNIGIHDADWRKNFGGEIYKKNGSHGCINVPPEIMPDLYEMVEIGTPVIMFY